MILKRRQAMRNLQNGLHRCFPETVEQDVVAGSAVGSLLRDDMRTCPELMSIIKVITLVRLFCLDIIATLATFIRPHCMLRLYGGACRHLYEPQNRTHKYIMRNGYGMLPSLPEKNAIIEGSCCSARALHAALNSLLFAARSSPRSAISLTEITLNGHVNQFPPLLINLRFMSSNSVSIAWGQLQTRYNETQKV